MKVDDIEKSSKKVCLKDKYRAYFPIGTAINSEMIERYGSIITDNFSSITLENEMKFSKIHPFEGEYSFEESDRLVEYALDNKMFVRGHTLVWHESVPDWLFNDNNHIVTRELLLDRIKEHIHTVVGKYKGKVYCWDVVNEVIDDSEELFYRHTPYYKIIGEDYIEKAFQYAHEADSDALLFLNDYNVCIGHKCEKIYKLVKRLKEKDVPIHGVGLQGHYNINYPSIDAIRKGIERIAELGIQIQFTEMDISVYGYEDRRKDLLMPTSEMMERQAESYGRLFELLREYKDVITGVTLWGVADDYSWLHDFPVEGRKDWPLLFDESLCEKDAYNSVIDW